MSSVKSDTRWASGQTIPGIVTIGDPRLKREARIVANIAEVCPLCEMMVARLRELNGAGLAAPQIGEDVRIIVIEIRKTDLFPDRTESPLYVMINPTLLESSSKTTTGWEGCFSVPGIMGIVPRSKRIRVKYTTLDGNEHDEIFEGYLARVVQHEYDHLNGFEFVCRMSSMDTLSTVHNWRQFHLNAGHRSSV